MGMNVGREAPDRLPVSPQTEAKSSQDPLINAQELRKEEIHKANVSVEQLQAGVESVNHVSPDLRLMGQPAGRLILPDPGDPLRIPGPMEPPPGPAVPAPGNPDAPALRLMQQEIEERALPDPRLGPPRGMAPQYSSGATTYSYSEQVDPPKPIPVPGPAPQPRNSMIVEQASPVVPARAVKLRDAFFKRIFDQMTGSRDVRSVMNDVQMIVTGEQYVLRISGRAFRSLDTSMQSKVKLVFARGGDDWETPAGDIYRCENALRKLEGLMGVPSDQKYKL